MKKRILSILLALCMVFSMMPMTAFAAEVEGPASAEITGVSLAVDGVTYTSGNVTISPNTRSIIYTVTGTNFENLMAENVLQYAPSDLDLAPITGTWGFVIDTENNVATLDCSTWGPAFVTCVNFEPWYSNDGGQSKTGTGIYISFGMDAPVEPEVPTPAEITGVSLAVDGVTYTSGNVTISPNTRSIIYTVTGTNFENLMAENVLQYAPSDLDLAPITGTWGFVIDTENNVATLDCSTWGPAFVTCVNFEPWYSNDGGQSKIDTGIYITFGMDAPICSCETKCTDGSVNSECAVCGADDADLAACVGEETPEEPEESGTIPEIIYIDKGNTDITRASFFDADRNYIDYSVFLKEVKGTIRSVAVKENAAFVMFLSTSGNTNTVLSRIPTDGKNFFVLDGGINEYDCHTGSWSVYNPNGSTAPEVPTPAEITGVSLAVDGVTYTSGNVTISPNTRSIIYTVTGTNFENLMAENVLQYAPSDLDLAPITETWGFVIDTENDVATLDCSTWGPAFVTCVNFEPWYSNDGGQSKTGTGIYLTFDFSMPLMITRQPTDASAKLGENYCVTVEAQGDGLKYQWYGKNAGSTTWFKSSVTDNTYDDVMTKARAGREVYCVISDAHGNKVQTDTVKILLDKEELTIIQQPATTSAALGEMFCAEVVAQGEGLKYQWYFRNKGSDIWYRSGQKDNTYDDIMTTARNGREVYCIITDTWGNYVQTDTVTLQGIVSAPLTITRQPATARVGLGEQFCPTVEAQGDGLKFQWYFRNKGSDIWYRSGQKDNTYDDVMTKARNGRELYCVVTDAWGNSVETDHVYLEGIPSVELTLLDVTYDAAKLGERYCVTVDAQGDGLTYTWYFRNPGASYWNKSGVKDNTYDDVMTKARANRDVYCVITDTLGNIVTTEIVTLSLS